jgi:adenine/guanine phosphoribosyltransferase-like PRPP-binding protein
MLSFKEYNELLEAIKQTDSGLQFNYSDKQGISTKFGKTKSFDPYVSKGSNVNGVPIYSIYKTTKDEYVDVTSVIKQLKKQQNLSPDDYTNFIRRTAIYISYKILTKSNDHQLVDVIITPDSTSSILDDLIVELKSRNPHISFVPKLYVKNEISKIEIDKNHPKISPSIIRSLEYGLKRANDKDSFQMKDFNKRDTKFLQNFYKLKDDPKIGKLRNSTVLVLDDLIASGTTLNSLIKDVVDLKSILDDEDSTSTIFGLTIFKT